MRALLLIAAAASAWAQPQGLLLSLSSAQGVATLRVDTPNFQLDAGESLHPSVEPGFTAEFTGRLTVLQAGVYSFEADGAELWIGGSRITAPTSLTAGAHPLRIQYRRAAGPAALQLRWKSAAFDWEPVPASAFSTTQAPPVEMGRRLVREYGCANCHRAPGLERPGPVLTRVGSRTNPAWLHAWLADPRRFRAGARMPDMLTAAQRADVTAYLATLRDTAAPARKRINEVIIGKGSELFGTVGCIACHQQPDLKLNGLGSKYTVESLAAFLRDPAQVEPMGYMPSLLLNEDDAVALAASLTRPRNPEFEKAPPPGDAARGKAAMESEGCLACHAVEGATNRKRAKALAELGDGGCLDASPGAGLPRFHLTAEERSAIAAYLRRYRTTPDRYPAPIFTLRERLHEFRCVNCHRIGAEGPLATLTEATPVLTGVGQKLRTSWIDQVLNGKQRIFSQHEIRMPHYTSAQTAGWAAAFAKAEGVAPGDGPAPPVFSDAQSEQGLGLIGTNPAKRGMGCIGCHDWGENKSLGEEGPQLMSLSSRLRFDWYRRWMRNPGRILSGTSMPAYFSGGDPKASETIDQLWAAMHAAPKLPAPEGFGSGGSDAEAKPIPSKEAIVIRWDMPEATPASIAVGLPGELSYCFDAGQSRLLYAWRGGFVDMTDTLFRKTDEKKLTPTAKLVGTVFWRSQEFPIRVGDIETPRVQFKGYRLVNGAPEFHYAVEGVEVFEHLRSEGGAIRRTVRFPRVDRLVLFEGKPVAQGTNITVEGELR